MLEDLSSVVDVLVRHPLACSFAIHGKCGEAFEPSYQAGHPLWIHDADLGYFPLVKHEEGSLVDTRRLVEAKSRRRDQRVDSPAT